MYIDDADYFVEMERDTYSEIAVRIDGRIWTLFLTSDGDYDIWEEMGTRGRNADTAKYIISEEFWEATNAKIDRHEIMIESKLHSSLMEGAL